jgi:uncharacterized protein
MTMIFVNLPVRDLAAARTFWNGLGYATKPEFSDERATNIVIDENIWLMLLDRSRFAEFTTGPVADPREATGVLVALSADSREDVDALVDKALATGASAWLPTQDQGFMYGRSFQDPEGHVVEVMWMDVSAVPGGDDATHAETPATVPA